ncbi:MAG: helix-turn-helix domain-containing protein [Actinomycetota bacterium]|nr:helix-turn-helix domain-containing protein [Actinomycetota bacterium]
MSEPVKRRSGGPTRSYDGSGRAAESDRTRRRVLDAARALLVEEGYRSTTVAAIAERAGVHHDTVYRLVGRKPVVLGRLVEEALSGEDRVVPASERPYVAAIRSAPDAATKIDLYAAATRGMLERLAPLFTALRDAAGTEPEARELWSGFSARRAANMRAFVADVAGAGGLRDGLDVETAADTVWLTNSPETYVMLTDERAWTPDRYERWLADTWKRLLLP